MKEAAALEALAHALARKVKQRAQPPDQVAGVLKVAGESRDALPAAYMRRIRLLAHAYQLTWLIDQHLVLRQNITELSASELRSLLLEMEEAREAITEGLPLEQTGLIKNMAQVFPKP